MREVPDDLRSPKQLANLLGVHPTTIRRWMRTGRLKGYRIGERTRASEAAALALFTEIEPDARAACPPQDLPGEGRASA